MRTYSITLTGTTPLIMHSDNIEWADRMDQWRENLENNTDTKKGDDRRPGFRWLGALYHDGSKIVIPGGNIMRCIMEGGTMVPVPGGRSGKTFKAQTQSGCQVSGECWPLLVNGKEIPIVSLLALSDESDFSKHKAAVTDLGFELFVKRAKIGQAKHVRVRPRFYDWSTVGDLIVFDKQITTEIIDRILGFAGRYKGLCDWRPGGRTPGQYGMFTAEITEK